MPDTVNSRSDTYDAFYLFFSQITLFYVTDDKLVFVLQKSILLLKLSLIVLKKILCTFLHKTKEYLYLFNVYSAWYAAIPL